MISLADMIKAGAQPGDRFTVTGFDPSRHIHTYDGQPIERPSRWVNGAAVVFLGWRQLTYSRRGQFSVNGEVWEGKGLASCLLVEEVRNERT